MNHRSVFSYLTNAKRAWLSSLVLCLACVGACFPTPGPLPTLHSCLNDLDCGTSQFCSYGTCQSNKHRADGTVLDDASTRDQSPNGDDLPPPRDNSGEPQKDKPDATPEMPQESSVPPDCTPVPEICDTIDNDCDGEIDEGLDCRCKPGESRACYTGPISQMTQGDCDPGVSICQTNGRWGRCERDHKPSTENCDRSDNDCDGTIDNLPENATTSCVPSKPNPKARCKKAYEICQGTKKLCQSVFVYPWLKPNVNNHHEGFVQPCRQAKFARPRAIAFDSVGNLYVTELDSNRIRKISPAGNVTVFAGLVSRGHGDGPATSAKFSVPSALAINDKDEIFVADTFGHRIRKIHFVFDGKCGTKNRHTGYCVTTVAGTGREGKDDGLAADATFAYPTGIAVTKSGIIYVADTNNDRIRKIENGTVTTVAGSTSGKEDGQGEKARFSRPTALLWDEDKQVLTIADTYNHAIRQMDAQANVTTLAGKNGEGNKNGSAQSAKFSSPIALARDAQGNLYIAERNGHTIRKLDTAGVVSVYIGKYKQAGHIDGDAATATLAEPMGVAIDAQNRLFITSMSTHYIRVVEDGWLHIYAGQYNSTGRDDGKRRCATVGRVVGIAETKTGTLYISDYERHAIYQIKDGYLSVYAGRPSIANNTDGDRRNARFRHPLGIELDAQGNLYVADYGNHRIRKITPQGTVTTIAGSKQGYKDNINPLKAEFYNPYELAIDSQGQIYVSDRDNHVIRKIDNSGGVSTFAGSDKGADNNKNPLKAKFGFPADIAFDQKGNMFIADSGNNRIRKIDISGEVTTFAGSTYGFGDNKDPLMAKFSTPLGLFFDEDGALYVTDFKNPIRRIRESDGVNIYFGVFSQSIMTLATPEYGARFKAPRKAHFRRDGTLIILDTDNRAAFRLPPCPQ